MSIHLLGICVDGANASLIRLGHSDRSRSVARSLDSSDLAFRTLPPVNGARNPGLSALSPCPLEARAMLPPPLEPKGIALPPGRPVTIAGDPFSRSGLMA